MDNSDFVEQIEIAYLSGERRRVVASQNMGFGNYLVRIGNRDTSAEAKFVDDKELKSLGPRSPFLDGIEELVSTLSLGYDVHLSVAHFAWFQFRSMNADHGCGYTTVVPPV